ncbi:hypothetical protein [Halalkalicoccus salilacus]|uniref:hypothetical protein n=1 Tax=Halalkalicoccus salilacus TaxID=3117459 RepID=UPI00300EB895
MSEAYTNVTETYPSRFGGNSPKEKPGRRADAEAAEIVSTNVSRMVDATGRNDHQKDELGDLLRTFTR